MQAEQNQFNVQHLKQAIKEEVFLSQILMYKKDLINHFIRKINIQEVKLEQKDFQVSKIERDIIIYELDRIKYYLKRYFRIRNKKIEQNIFYILKYDMKDFFSTAEFNYAVAYWNILMKQYQNSFFNQVHSYYGKEKFIESIQQKSKNKFQMPVAQDPDDDKHVMVKFDQDLEKFQLSDDQNVKVLKGEVALVRQKFVNELIQKKKVKLIQFISVSIA